MSKIHVAFFSEGPWYASADNEKNLVKWKWRANSEKLKPLSMWNSNIIIQSKISLNPNGDIKNVKDGKIHIQHAGHS